MKKSTVISIVCVVLFLIIGSMIFMKRDKPVTTTVKETEADLPINTLAIEDRPYVTLAPDATGRTLVLSMDMLPKEGELEYEMIYDAGGSQQGAFGTLILSSQSPIIKDVLLGSKSGGGKISYHEGVTGGSLTLTYNNTRLKESWNYLKFDPADPSFSSVDGKFTVTLGKTALKKDVYITTMKTFGYPKAGLPTETIKLAAGPYSYFTQAKAKGSAAIAIKLPAGDHINPTIYEWSTDSWKKLVTKLEGEMVTSTSLLPGSSYIVVAE